MTHEINLSISEAIFVGDSKMAALMRAHDWSATPVGRLETCPESLKTAIRIILGSRSPMFVWWGQPMTNFYNDACIPILGQRHPQALGQPAFEVWADIWNMVEPQAEAVLNEGKLCCNEDLRLTTLQNSYSEEAYFTFSYSPLMDDDGRPSGLFCTITEETKRVLGDREMRTLRQLAAETETLIEGDYLTKPFSKREWQTLRIETETAKQQVESILSNISDGFFVFDRNWRFTYVNDRLCEMTGLPREEMLGRSNWELFPDAVNTDVYVQFHRALHEQTPIQFEYFYLSWNRWYEYRVYPSPNGLSIFAAEITERKQAELTLVEQKRLLEMIARGQPLDDCVYAVCASVSQLNPRARACFLLADAQMTFPRSITPDFPPSFGQGLKDAPINQLCIGTCSTDVYCGEPVTCTDIANDDRWSQGWRDLCVAHGILACHSTPIFGVDGRPLGSFMLCFDEARMPTDWEYQLADFGTKMISIVFERDRSILALQKSEVKYRTLFELIDEGFCICEMLYDKSGEPTDYRFLEVNPAFEIMTGLQQATGKTMRELIPNLESSWFEIYGRVVRTGEPVRFENQSSVMNRWFDVNAFCIGEPQSHQFAVLFTNISKRRHFEQERDRFLAVGSDLQVITGMNGYFQWVSPTFERILGWTVDEMISRPWTDFVHPDDINPSVSETDNLFSGNETFAFENRYRHKDGSYRWLLWNAQPYPKEKVIYGAAIDITERKQAEASLQESQALFEAFMGYFPATVYIKDEAGRYLYVNPLNERICNRPLADWLGKTDFELFAIAQAQKWRAHDLSAMAAGQAIEVTETLTQEDGEHYFISFKFPIPQSSGQQLLGGISLDVTERHRAEIALHQSEEQLRLATEAANLGMWYWDGATDRLTWTDRAKAMFGLPADTEMSMQVFLEAVHPDDRQFVLTIVSELQAGQMITEVEFRTLRADGTVCWILARGDATYDAQGTLSATRGVLMDITERKQVEATLAANEAKLRAFVESSVVGILYGDIYGNIWEANDELLRIVGYTRDDLKAGRLRWLDITPPEFLPLDELGIAEAQARGACTPYEKEYISKDGNRIPVLVGYTLLGEAREESVAFILDISDRKRAERQLQQQASDLKQLNAALEQTTSKLIERNQELDRFVYTVSHDLKAPLRAIHNLSQWIADDLEGQLDEQNLRQMQLLQSRVVRMEALINGLLAYSRIGRTEIATEKVNVGELLYEILDSLTILPTFTISVSEMPTLLTKRLLLSQVFSNLINNAIKHHDRPDGWLEIRANQKGEYYEFSVADNGPGIAPKNHERVFEIFQTLKGQDVPESTGIGLSIVKKIIETEGGSIVLESQLDKGATFRFTWPIQPLEINE